ncbi:hypothetical protein PHK61_05900 [Actinomycetospora lutea]|uniref:hypothetical protein n=1 Tax=Actinomycetospora lutea TaxID=663604 RepID=UPI0023651A35|nr:hypothetical protein [Actinomycetospora lutea]MDD7937948.1 hypothetical protein [Actinomycetospora lutea]
MSEPSNELQLDDSGVAVGLPRPVSDVDQIADVPYRAVAFRDDDLASALERSASWLRSTEAWLGEPLDVSGIHLDYDNGADSPYFEVKLLCNEEDLAGAPLLRRRHQAGQS